MTRRVTAYLALTTAGIAQPLLQLYGNNNAVFTAARIQGAQVVVFALVVLAAPTATLTLLEIATTRLVPRRVDAVQRVLTTLAALPLGLLLLRNLDIPWPAVAVTAVGMGAGVAWVHARVPGVRTWMSWMSPYAALVLTLFVVGSQGVIVSAEAEVVEVSRSTTSVPRGATNPADVSVVWLQLDEAPLWPLLRTDGTINSARFPGFAALADVSTWYRNTLGLSQTTVDAVPAMLTGREPVTGRAPTYWNYKRNVFALMYGRRAMDVHEMATALCPREACATVSVSGGDDIATAGTDGIAPSTTSTVPVVPVQRGPDWSQFARDTLVVLGHKLLPAGLRDHLPPIDEGWGGFGTNGGFVEPSSASPDDTTDPASDTTSVGSTTVPPTRETLVETKRNTVTTWERGGAPSQVPVVEGMVTRAAQASVPTFHFAHVLLPHRPWQLTPDMRTTRAITTDKRSAEVEDRVRDEYQAFLAQYAATDSLVLNLVNSLRRSANWDRTMIIVTADHGIAFEPGESKRKDINPRNAHTLEQIYRVPLFVKWPDQRRSEVNDCAVQGFDVLPMVMDATGLQPDWTLVGMNPRRDCPVRTDRTIWWDKGSTTMSSDFDAVVGEATRLSRWVDANGSVDDIARPAAYTDWFDVTIPASPRRETSIVRWTVNQKEEFARVGSARLARTPMQFDGTFTARTRTDDDVVGLVVVRNRVVAVIPEMGAAPSGSSHYRSMVLPSALVRGKMSPELWVGRGSPESPQLTRVGAPGG